MMPDNHHLPFFFKKKLQKHCGSTVTFRATEHIKAVTKAVWQLADNHATKLDISKWVRLPYTHILKSPFKSKSGICPETFKCLS